MRCVGRVSFFFFSLSLSPFLKFFLLEDKKQQNHILRTYANLPLSSPFPPKTAYS